MNPLNALSGLNLKLARSFRRFLVTGTLTVCVDAIIYSLFLYFDMHVLFAKTAGLISATIFAYFVNRIWAFEAGPGSTTQFLGFVGLYAAAVTLNVSVNWFFLHLLGSKTPDYIMAWLMATAASSIWNYVGLRYYVFRPIAS